MNERRTSLARTGGRTPHVPAQTPAPQEAGPELDINLIQLTSDADGTVNTTEWMHKYFGHACGCGEGPSVPSFNDRKR
jgi:hypothetical protein